MTDPVGLVISSPSQPHRLHSEERMSAHTIGDDTILGGIEGDLIDGDVGNDTLFGWAPDPIQDVVERNELDEIMGYGDGPEPDTETIIIDGWLWRIVRRGPADTIINGKARRLVEVEEV